MLILGSVATKCPECDEVFSLRFKMKNHRKNNHKEEIRETEDDNLSKMIEQRLEEKMKKVLIN